MVNVRRRLSVSIRLSGRQGGIMRKPQQLVWCNIVEAVHPSWANTPKWGDITARDDKS